MAFGIDYPVISSGSAFTSIDPYNSALENNGAQNILGAIYQTPLSANVLASAKGQGSNRYLKYVRYNPTASQALKTGPAIVYWKDETFTTVTPTSTESFMGINGIAGWLLYNTTTTSAAVAADINGNYVFIHVGGFLANAWVTAATVAGLPILGAAGSFATGTVAANTAPTNAVAGWTQAAAASSLVDLFVPLLV